VKRRFSLINRIAEPVTATTAELVDITHDINTRSVKKAGYEVFNTTTQAPVWAEGSTAGDVWNDATGTTAHTPA
jgi:S-adenosylmethionine hydrolase